MYLVEIFAFGLFWRKNFQMNGLFHKLDPIDFLALLSSLEKNSWASVASWSSRMTLLKIILILSLIYIHQGWAQKKVATLPVSERRIYLDITSLKLSFLQHRGSNSVLTTLDFWKNNYNSQKGLILILVLNVHYTVQCSPLISKKNSL